MAGASTVMQADDACHASQAGLEIFERSKNLFRWFSPDLSGMRSEHSLVLKTKKMDDQGEEPKRFMPKINLVAIEKSPLLVTSPRSRGTMQKSSSARFNCLCSPTTHAGSFRCRHHRNPSLSPSGGSVGSNLSELAAKATTISDQLHAQ